jgi:flagellar capping protein FliD
MPIVIENMNQQHSMSTTFASITVACRQQFYLHNARKSLTETTLTTLTDLNPSLTTIRHRLNHNHLKTKHSFANTKASPSRPDDIQ